MANAAHRASAFFGERTGRVIVAVRPEHFDAVILAAREADVVVTRLGQAGGDDLHIRGVAVDLRATLGVLASAWTSPF